jgi:MFS family permease
LGWLSFGGYGLAIVLAVESATGSFVVAGAAVAAFSAGSALLAPVRGRFVDRRGPRALAYLAVAARAGWLRVVAQLLGARRKRGVGRSTGPVVQPSPMGRRG